MIFENPLVLYLTPIILLAVVALFYIGHKRTAANIQKFIAPKLKDSLLKSVSKERRITKYILIILGILLILCGLARPQWGHSYQEIKGKGIDLLFAIDVSKSMLAQDVKPNRIKRAQLAILDFLDNLKSDRVGLIAFAGTSFLQCPLTLDYDAFRQTLNALSTDTIMQGGTNISSAIHAAELSFKDGHNFKILILITDGENLDGSVLEKAKDAAKKGITIYTIGVGTPDGEIIQIINEKGELDYLRDGDGKIVKTKLDESALREIAKITHGFYSPLGSRGEGLAQIYNIGLKDIQPEEFSSHFKQVPLERFQWFIGLGLFLLMLEIIIKDRKRNRTRSKNLSIGFLALLLVMSTENKAHASAREGDKLYNQGNFEQAKEAYTKALEKASDPSKLNYNIGATDYKNEKYEQAINFLKKSLPTDNIEIQKDAFYNLANSEYRLGQQTAQSDPQQTVQLWESSIKNYQNTLDLNPEDKEAQYNQEFVKKKLEELKQQQEQEQENNQEDHDQDHDEQKEDDSSKDKKQNNQDKEEPDGQNNDSTGDDENEADNDDSQNNPSPSESSEDDPNQESEEHNPQNPSDSESQQEEQQQQSQPSPTNGTMTHGEAEDLLDSLKGSEKKLPLGDEASSIGQPNKRDYKDW